MKRSKPVCFFLCLAALCLLGFWGCGSDQPEASQSVAGNAENQTPDLNLVALVNESRNATLGGGMPLWVSLHMGNPTEHPGLSLRDMDTGDPCLVSDSGTRARVDWRRIAPLTERPAMGLAWVADGLPAEGGYRLLFPDLEKSLQASKPGSGHIKVETAYLKVTSGTGDPTLTAHYRRRLLAWQGKWSELLAELNEVLAVEPSNTLVRSEKVKALALSGDFEAAHAELSGLLMDMEEAKSKASPGAPPHIPAGYLDYLRFLEEAAQKGK